MVLWRVYARNERLRTREGIRLDDLFALRSEGLAGCSADTFHTDRTMSTDMLVHAWIAETDLSGNVKWQETACGMSFVTSRAKMHSKEQVNCLQCIVKHRSWMDV